MKFIVSSGDLLNRLQVAVKAIASKSPIEILENFLFTIKGKQLSITASDSDVIIVTTLAVSEADHDGSVAIPGSRLIEYLKRLPEQPVSFNVNDENFAVEISTVTGSNSQMGRNAADYPQLQGLDSNSQSFVVKSDVLIAGISHTLFATGNDELRPIMNGIFFDIEPNEMTFVATDSHILARYTRDDAKAGIKSSFVLGKKPASLLKSILSAGDDIEVTYDGKSAIFKSTNHTLTCRLVDGVYPQYKSVIPVENPFHVSVNRQDITNAVLRTALCADGTELVKFDLNSNSVRVSAQDLDFSCKAEETLECQYDGQPMKIGLKASYFTSILSNVNANEIEMQISDPSRAALIIPVDKKEHEDELMLIMPMKV